ncbi:MAG: peptide chain release factor aRF-1 [Candidatus Diapherotrites archaeon]|uniref:Peptide chain release factor aRF-1 n=1 Tax=Candidatus Iainarchaeum sp. TaxID=3101447 RepID=A0A8T4LA29_9ARCH|nr:peptide chain release factor aRF-1 [Candidatus Diapherotrites archaeon]
MKGHALEEVAESELAVFKKKLKLLAGFKGHGTELISQYIPANADRSTVMGVLTEEVSQSGNIKSPQTRKAVQGALRKITNFLKQIDFDIPPKGIVVFAGNVSESEGRTDIRLFTVRPPKPLKTKLYWCDSEFHLAPLKEMLAPSEVYGLLTIDKNEATIAVLSGKKYEIIGKFTSGVPGKFRAGGQCLVPDSLVQTATGEIIPVGDVHNPLNLQAADLEALDVTSTAVLKKWTVTKKEAVKIMTEPPRTELTCSLDHLVFAYQEGTTKAIPAEDVNVGTVLLYADFGKTPGRKIRLVKVKSVERLRGRFEMVDLSTAQQNFLANGLVVHNSSHRFEQLRAEAAKEFYKRISDKINTAFTAYADKLKGIIIGGPGVSKQYFLNVDMIDHRLKPKILGMLDISYTDESGIRELIQRSEELLRETDLMKERGLLNKFLEEVARGRLATYGQREVEAALAAGKAGTLIVSEALEWEVHKYVCEGCKAEQMVFIKEPLNYKATAQPCGKCGREMELLEEIDYIDYLLEKAQKTGAEVRVVSTDTPEGEQFFKGFGGIAAMLRY